MSESTPNLGNLVTVLEDRGFSIKHEVLLPDCGEPWHFHKQMRQWFLPIEGDLTILTKCGPQNLAEHRVVSLAPLETHRVWNTSSAPSRFYLISSSEANDRVTLEFDYPPLRTLKCSTGAHLIVPLYAEETEAWLQKHAGAKRPATSQTATTGCTPSGPSLPTAFGIFVGGQLVQVISLSAITRFSYAIELALIVGHVDSCTSADLVAATTQLLNTLILDFGFRGLELVISGEANDVAIVVDELQSQGLNLITRSPSESRLTTDGKSFLAFHMPGRLRQFSDELASHFWRLNAEWIETFFELEEKDRTVLGDPKRLIVDRGGEVFFVQAGDDIVATGAMMPIEGGQFELTKMATTGRLQGLGFGDMVISAAIEWGKRKGLPSITLFTQSTLFKAIRLYEKHGFTRVPITESGYARADTKMVLTL